MDRVDSSGSDLDLSIDLESGGTTSEEDASKIQVLTCQSSKILLGRTRGGFMSTDSLCESANGGDCSCSYEKFIVSYDNSAKSKEQLGRYGEVMKHYVHNNTMGKEKTKEHKSAKPSKPPRPPRGPSLDACDMKLLKEISELNLKRRRAERNRTLKKIKNEKSPSLNSNLFACLVTIIFFLVIIFQGLLGSRV